MSIIREGKGQFCLIAWIKLDSEDSGLYNIRQLISAAQLSEARNSLLGSITVVSNDRYIHWVN